MKKINAFLRSLLLWAALVFGAIVIAKPQLCREGVAMGIILSGKVLIPSLFPFSVCMLYIIKSGVTENMNFLKPVTRILGFSPYTFFIFIFSLLGGYPIGTKLISEAVKNGNLTPKEGRKMLNYCVNAGPSFIVSAVGGALLGSSKLGYILLISHILASVVICLLSGKITDNEKPQRCSVSPAENFVSSAADSAACVLGICGFVILFSVITQYLEYYGSMYPVIKPLMYICEVTNAVTKTRNIYLISALLGFSGISIWCQVISVGKDIKINFYSFALFRVLHAALSGLFTFVLLKIFPVSLPTFSNVDSVSGQFSVSDVKVGVSLIIMGLIFVISLVNREKSRKILEEFV